MISLLRNCLMLLWLKLYLELTQMLMSIHSSQASTSNQISLENTITPLQQPVDVLPRFLPCIPSTSIVSKCNRSLLSGPSSLSVCLCHPKSLGIKPNLHLLLSSPLASQRLNLLILKDPSLPLHFARVSCPGQWLLILDLYCWSWEPKRIIYDLHLPPQSTL